MQFIGAVLVSLAVLFHSSLLSRSMAYDEFCDILLDAESSNEVISHMSAEHVGEIDHIQRALESTPPELIRQRNELCERRAGSSDISPRGVHVAANEEGGLSVVWATAGDSMNHSAQAMIQYWVNETCSIFQNASSYTYTVPKKWWDPTGSSGSIQHAVQLQNTPRSFRYRVGTVDTGLLLPPLNERCHNASSDPFLSSSQVFRAALPPTTDGDEPTRLAVAGDMGSVQLFGFLVAQQMIEDFGIAPNSSYDVPFGAPDAFLLVGDISYAGIAIHLPILNITSGDEFEPFWDLYLDMMQPISARLPFMLTVGNHDMFYNATAFRHRFLMPSTGRGNFWYSYTMGNSRFISLSTEHPYGTDSEQYAWAQKALKEAVHDRIQGRVAWIVVLYHRPMYCSDASEWDQHRPGAPLQADIEPLLLTYDVDLAISGHMHAYERVHPNKNGTVVTRPRQHGNTQVYDNPKAPVHVVSGTAGAVQRETWIEPSPSWSAVRFANQLWGSYGYGWLETTNRTHLHYTFRPVQQGGHSSIGDDFWIVRDP
eukprot:gb/GECG01013200.1/.p1 GENE.gb/GECG01013200.1/~~gb/GECG01013200.1/.p1  ORF type:complete len:539 (+),score=38.97 gb/GECG01013200.1/:1-1617(+)